MPSRTINFLTGDRRLFGQAISAAVYRYIFPLFSVAALTLLRISLTTTLPSSVYLLYTTIVFLHAWLSGFYSGMIAAVASALVAQYFFQEPVYTFKFDHPEYLLLTCLFLLQCTIIAYLTGSHSSNMQRMREAMGKLSFGERKLRDTIDSVFTLIAIVAPTGKILEANRAFADLFPQMWDDVTGRNISELPLWRGSMDTRIKLQQALAKATKGNPSRYDEKILVEGTPVYLELSFAPIFKPKTRQTEYIIVSAIDITERKEYEQDLERVQENYRRLINSNVIGMVISDIDGKIAEANDAFLRTIGYSREQFTTEGLHWQDIIDSDAQESTELFESVKLQNSIGPVQHSLIHREDNHLVPIVLHALLIDEDNNKMLCLVVDISEQKALEHKKDEFLSIASHELKTPLTTLKGYAQLLSKRLQERNEEHLKYMNVVERQTNKLTELIDDLLDVSRLQSGKLTISKDEFNLIDLIEETIRDIQLLSQQHKITFAPHPHMINISADRFRITQVLTNFLTNAIKYSADADQINVYVKTDQQQVIVTVEDFGQGVPHELLDKIFDKFFQAAPQSRVHSQSLGLGLYISAEIIRYHGGHIWANSEMGVGSKFSFSLPLD